jgi:hypothetical protein
MEVSSWESNMTTTPKTNQQQESKHHNEAKSTGRNPGSPPNEGASWMAHLGQTKQRAPGPPTLS